MTRWGCLVVLLVTILMALGWAQRLGAEKIRYATVFPTPPVELPALAAEEMGLWKQNGLETEWISFKGGSPTFRAAAAAALDMGVADLTSTILAISRQMPVVMVARYGAPQVYGIWVPTVSPIKTPQDLKGTRIAVSRVGGTSHAYGLALVRALGLEKDVKFVGILGSAERQAALKSGAISAMVHTLSAVAVLKAEGEIRELISAAAHLPKELNEEYMIFSHTTFAEKQPATVKKAIRAILQASSFVEKNQDWTIAKLKTVSGYSEQAARLVFPTLTFSKDGQIDRKALEAVRDFLIRFGLLAKEKAPTLDRIAASGFMD